jgi:hypothetical protein
MERFNPVTCEMVFPRQGSIPVTEVSVQKVIRVPREKLQMRYETDVLPPNSSMNNLAM